MNIPHINLTMSIVNNVLIPSSVLEEMQHPVLYNCVRVVMACIPGLFILIMGVVIAPERILAFVGLFVIISSALLLIPVKSTRIGISKNDGSIIITNPKNDKIIIRHPKGTYRFETDKELNGRYTTSWYMIVIVQLPTGKTKKYRLLAFHDELDKNTVVTYVARMSTAINNWIQGNPYDPNLIVDQLINKTD